MIGYARVSTDEQVTDAQLDELRSAGVAEIVEEKGSGADKSRPALAALMRRIERNDVLVVVRLDRLARSVSHLLEVVETLQQRGAHFRSLRDPIDTSTPQGMFSLQVLGAVAQLERALIRERTKSGIAAAKLRGVKMGAPALRDKATRKATIAMMTAARDKVTSAKMAAGASAWLPTLLAMRPAAPWADVRAVLAQAGQHFSEERLRRASRRCVREGLAPASILQRSERRAPDDRLMQLVCAIRLANPQLSVRDIGRQLGQMRERTIRGGSEWSPSSVQMLLDRAVREGLLPASQIEERAAA